MSTPLPPDIDFVADPSGSKERMNRAMIYLYGKIVAAAALQPEFQSALDTLQRTGLQRINDLLTPLIQQAQNDVAHLDQLLADWTTGTVLTQLQAQIEADVAAQLEVLGAKVGKAVPDAPAAGLTLQSSGDPDQPNLWVDPRYGAEAERFFWHKR